MSSLDGLFDNNYGLTQSEIDEISGTFSEFDLNKNGYIIRDEVKQCFKYSNIIAEGETVDSVLKQMDWNHDGRVSYGEYLKFMATIFRDQHTHLKRQSPNINNFVGSITK
jgi:Ca2+-binding EF-hand superfamily protein